jgi:hypothetical protein
MGIASKLLKELPKWGAVILVVVIFSIVMINFKTDAVCPTGYEYNETSSTTGCVLETNNSVVLTGDPSNEILGSIDTTVTGLQEPANWTDIIVIVLVGVGVLALVIGALSFRKGGMGGMRFS